MDEERNYRISIGSKEAVVRLRRSIEFVVADIDPSLSEEDQEFAIAEAVKLAKQDDWEEVEDTK